MSNTQPQPQSDELDDESVREYLKQHEDFFERHPDMLDYLHISHGSGSAVSLVEKQVSVLRERNIEMRKRNNNLTNHARTNDSLFANTRTLVVALLEAKSRAELAAAFNHAMKNDFEVEYTSFILFGDPADSSEGCRIESSDSANIEIGSMLKNGKATCGTLRREELSYLFPAADSIGSAAVMPLVAQTELGVIAVGNSNPSYYTSNMGTMFLNHVAEVLVRLLPKLESSISG
ncbi:DUF484 family protein [Halieaceae bacterium IMCC14734]|uniref:DUF484 family protein n=1 Tax=Candidatus Litorirhabdus singularis TaxID=2518993 RepID=A0ABT3TDL4_9GAMM|nr:DUF484 family protein [Candidatus Litorirhabdus singularis]MCX2979529.1 DUF484 family protein [Candidatus Litorirhabdus singularis]